MHLLIIAGFALVLWRSGRPPEWLLVPDGDIVWSVLAALGQIPLLLLAAVLACRHAARMLRRAPDAPGKAQSFYHRATAIVRFAALVCFAATMLLTRWPDLFDFSRITPVVQVVGDLIMLAPFLATVIGVWVAAFPMERMLRGDDHAIGATAGPAWRRGEYLDFNIRHHVLVVAVPMTIILFASNICDGYERELVAWLRVPWAPEMLLGIVACGVFLIAPLLLCRIWRTVPLNDGPVRTRLEAVCRRIGLRCRGILVWKSDGMVINAAVMGVAAPVRYVLLSDGLLETMSEPQIEAVFAHEAGHIRHRHLQHFLVFALVGWLFVAGFTELIARGFGAVDGAPGLSFVTIQGVGVVVTAIVWGVGFGWVSRRFERQADVFGARCVAPDAAACHMPCSVHIDDDTTLDGSGRLCATGAAIFASALDRVATLNAIPHDERSWRHSSIGSRMRFLTNLANDPQRAAQFDRLVRTIKRTLVIAAMVGCAATALYWEVLGTPVLVRMQLTGP